MSVETRPRAGRRRWAPVAVAFGAVVGLGVAVALQPGDATTTVTPLDLRSRTADAMWPASARPAPGFSLLDQDGRRISLASIRGRVVLLTFLDSHCRELCTVEGPVLDGVQESFPRAERPVIAVVSVNPADTPSSVRAVADRWGWGDGAWHWMMGTQAQLAPVWRAYGIDVVPAGGDVAHTSALYVIDAAGDRRAGFAAPLQADRVTSAIRWIGEVSS